VVVAGFDIACTRWSGEQRKLSDRKANWTVIGNQRTAPDQDTGSLIVSAKTKPVATPTTARSSNFFQVKPMVAGRFVM